MIHTGHRRRRHSPWRWSALGSLGATLITISSSHATALAATPVSSSTCPTPVGAASFYAPAVHGTSKTIALTFDDGPGRSTPAILSILLKYHVRATFFNIGEQETWYPSSVREEVRDGFLVGDHSWSHPDLELLGPGGQAKQIDWVINEQRTLTGSQACVFRPPYGDYNASILSIAKDQHLSLWMWSASTADWQAEGSGSSTWIHRIIANGEAASAQDHPVLLMHNQAIAMPATVAALPTIITYFRDRGYTFVDLLGRGGAVNSCGAPPVLSASVAATTLSSGSTLSSGDSIVSPSGQFRLTMNVDGALQVTTANGRVLWQTPTSGHRGALAKVAAGGVLQVQTPSGSSLWKSPAGFVAGDTLSLRNDGDLTLVSGDTIRWSSGSLQSSLTTGEHLDAGWMLQSPDRSCQLTLSRSGILRLSGTEGTIWSLRTAIGHSAQLNMQHDGTLTLSEPTGTVWTSNTGNHSGAVLSVTPHGTMVITRGATPLWSTD